jgi:oxygen-dependent protoporphyrinogen oxidase
VLTVVRRWPNSLPQYTVGHPDRVAELEAHLRSTLPGLILLGNALHGVGLPDLIRAARAAARSATASLTAGRPALPRAAESSPGRRP